MPPLLLLPVALLFVGCLIRWARTPEDHPDAAARADMTRLVGLTLLGMCAAAFRARYPFGSAIYWTISALLVPIGAVALWLIMRLLRAYRRA